MGTGGAFVIGRIDFRLDDKKMYAALWATMQAVSPKGSAMFLDQVYLRWLKERAAARFQNQGDDTVGNWAPLKPATLEYRREAGFSPTPINVRTGAMRAWMTESDPKFFFKGTGVTMRYPGNVPRGELRSKVKTAQSGRGRGNHPGPKTPPRPILGIGAPDLVAAVRLYGNWIEGFMRNPMDLGAGPF